MVIGGHVEINHINSQRLKINDCELSLVIYLMLLSHITQVIIGNISFSRKELSFGEGTRSKRGEND